MSIRFQVVSDGYEASYSNGDTVIPVLTETGAQRVRVDGSGPMSPETSPSVVAAQSTTFSSGQQAVTTTAAAIGSTTAFKNGCVITNLSTSTASCFIGGSDVATSNGFELAAGASIVVPVADISTLYVRAAANSTATVAWIGFN